MIYSLAQDHWETVRLVHSIAKLHYIERQKWQIAGYNKDDEMFPFSIECYTSRQKEIYAVGLVMTWSVITIESLCNHAIADIFDNKGDALDAINSPRKITTRLKISTDIKSDLAYKVHLISDGRNALGCVSKAADRISFIRNDIVHDKPFDYYITQDGDLLLGHYSKREHRCIYKYDDLPDFFRDCDEITAFILQVSTVNLDSAINFSSLLS